jgi:sugar/nucleoside kinase (ribokinase family)
MCSSTAATRRRTILAAVSILCLGEALVDLVCERPVADLSDADAFVPHFGGATANVCVSTVRHGGRASLVGGAGDDPWGHWLHDRLVAEGVGLEFFRLVEGAPTPVAFVAVDGGGEPSYVVYGAGVHAALAAAAEALPAAAEAADALFFSSNTLVEEDERAATLAARERALELGRPFDPNLRVHRWPNAARAAGEARGCVPGAFLVKCNRHEAELLTGEADPERAAAGLLAAGARNVIVTLGEHGAILRGEFRAQAPAVAATVVNMAGAGDAFMGAILARLSQTGFYPPALVAALPDACRAAAAATERWGAV